MVMSDSIVYESNSVKKLDRISYYTNSTLELQDELEYDSKNRFVKVYRKYIFRQFTYENHELIYNSEGKPQTLNSWGHDTSFPPQVTNFYYDSKGRLNKREIQFGTDTTVYRYEYDNKSNVIKIFYKPLAAKMKF